MRDDARILAHAGKEQHTLPAERRRTHARKVVQLQMSAQQKDADDVLHRLLLLGMCATADARGP
jgi:hypothetical protein